MELRHKQRVADGDDADRVHQLGGIGVLEDEAARAAAQRIEHVLVGRERRQYDDLHGAEIRVSDDATCRLVPVDAGHADVHQHDITPSPGCRDRDRRRLRHL